MGPRGRKEKSTEVAAGNDNLLSLTSLPLGTCRQKLSFRPACFLTWFFLNVRQLYTIDQPSNFRKSGTTHKHKTSSRLSQRKHQPISTLAAWKVKSFVLCVLFAHVFLWAQGSSAQSVVAADGLSPVGICWGRVSHAPIPPNPIVSMLKNNPYIARVKLFDANGVVLSALAELGTSVEVMVMVKNGELQGVAVSDTTADGWLYANVLAIQPTGVNIKYISVGNEPYLNSTTASDYDNYLMLAVNRMQGALERAGIDSDVKLTVSFNLNIVQNSSVPSNASFAPMWATQIANVTSLINRTSSFFSVNIYPFFTYKDQPSIPLNFIMFNTAGSTKPTTVDGQYSYFNIFDASVDALLVALAKIGFGNIDVRIGEVGWPTDGHPNATLALSQQFNQLAVQHLLSGVGTPRRPNIFFPFYLFALLDEDAKGIKAGAFERRWGLYDDLGNAKYALDLSGAASSSASLPSIPGLVSLSKRWCTASSMFTSDPSSADSVAAMQSLISSICGASSATSSDFSDAADCTPMTSNMSSPGLQCLAAASQNPQTLLYSTSYVLNLQYQVQGQTTNSCTAGGYGEVTYTDQSDSLCAFPIGLDIPTIEKYYESPNTWSWEAFGYIVGLIVVLATFL